MNLYHFEFTTYYLTHIAINCFTTKHYELNFPIVLNDTINGKRQNTDEVKLLSIFQTETDPKNPLFKNQWFDKQTNQANQLSLDPSKISIWKEYFCRFDENKRDIMSHQVQTAEMKDRAAVIVSKVEETVQDDIEELLKKLKSNQERINHIRNIDAKG